MVEIAFQNQTFRKKNFCLTFAYAKNVCFRRFLAAVT